jgi:hypothetical protein
VHQRTAILNDPSRAATSGRQKTVAEKKIARENDASDPFVWSGRASQEVFVDLAALRSCINVSGL